MSVDLDQILSSALGSSPLTLLMWMIIKWLKEKLEERDKVILEVVKEQASLAATVAAKLSNLEQSMIEVVRLTNDMRASRGTTNSGGEG